MMTIAQLVVEVDADTHKAIINLKIMDQKVKETGGFFHDAASHMLGFLGANVIQSGFDKLTSGFTDLIKTGFDYNVTMEHLHAQLQAIGGPGGSADAILAWVQKFGQQVPDTTEHLAEATVHLEAFGFNAQEVMPKLANVAAAMGKDLPTAAQAFTDAFEGRFQMMATELGISKDALIQFGMVMDSHGHVDPKSFLAAFEALSNAKFGTGTKDAMQTMAGQLTNLQDKWQQFAGLLMKPIFDFAKQAFAGFFAFVDAHQGTINAVATAIGTGLVSALKFLGTVLGGIVQGLGWVWGIMQNLAPTFNTLASVLGGSLSTSFDKMKKDWLPIIQSLVTWFQTQMLPAILNILGPIERLVKTIITQGIPAFFAIRDAIMHVVAVIVSALLPIFETVMPIVVSLAGFLIDLAQNALAFLIPKVEEAVKAISKFATEMATRLGPFIHNLANGIKVVADTISKIWNALWPTISAVVKTAWDYISGIVKIAWDYISGLFKIFGDILSGNWGQLWEDIKSLVVNVWDDIKSLFGTLWKDLINIVKNIWPLLQAAFKFVWDNLLAGLDNVRGWVMQKWNDLWTWVGALPGNVWGWVSGHLKDLWTNIVAAVVGAKDAVVKAFNDFIIQPVEDAFTTLTNTLKDLWNEFMIWLGLQDPAKEVINSKLAGGAAGNFGPTQPVRGGATGHAYGGVMPYAGYTWVGEHGPEPIFLPQHGRVVSREDAMRAVAGGGGQSTTINLHGPTSDQLMQQLTLYQQRQKALVLAAFR